jgi:hypothetical protein
MPKFLISYTIEEGRSVEVYGHDKRDALYNFKQNNEHVDWATDNVDGDDSFDYDTAYVMTELDEETEELEMTPKFDIEVQLNDGNAFFILGTMQKALRNAGATPDEVQEFMNTATEGDYDNLLRTCMEYANIS